MGLPRRACRPRAPRTRHRGHPLRGAGRPCPRARRARGTRRPRRGRAAALPRHRERRLRRGDGHRDGGARGRHRVPRFRGPSAPDAASARPSSPPADVTRLDGPRRRCLHRDLHRARHAHAPRRTDPDPSGGGGARSPLDRVAPRALRHHHRGLAPHPGGPLGRLRRPGGRTHRPGLAPLPRRQWPRLRPAPHGRRPDPRGEDG